MVGINLQNVYDQTVATDSRTVVTEQLYLSIYIMRPTVAPYHSLSLTVTATAATVSSDAAFEFGFLTCSRGEYYGERICNKQSIRRARGHIPLLVLMVWLCLR